MNDLNCEYVRDVYPDVLNGRADPTIAQQVHAHLTACDECRAEAALIAAIHAQPIIVPAGLHQRIVHAAARPAARWRISRSSVAMAATLAAALIGGSVILRWQDQPQRSAGLRTTSAPAAHGIGAVGVEDAMMSGKSSLDDLSVEQLEKLLKEVQS